MAAFLSWYFQPKDGTIEVATSRFFKKIDELSPSFGPTTQLLASHTKRKLWSDPMKTSKPFIFLLIALKCKGRLNELLADPVESKVMSISEEKWRQPQKPNTK